LNRPEKLYYKIGEVAEILELKTHVLRFWETEFQQLKPVKSSTNQRLYRREDVETALLIKDLLYQRGFTISGARQQLKADAQKKIPQVDNATAQQVLKDIKEDIQRIRRRLVESDA
jgi:DNA-binding transcriptional MerR regulator